MVYKKTSRLVALRFGILLGLIAIHCDGQHLPPATEGKASVTHKLAIVGSRDRRSHGVSMEFGVGIGKPLAG